MTAVAVTAVVVVGALVGLRWALNYWAAGRVAAADLAALEARLETRFAGLGGRLDRQADSVGLLRVEHDGLRKAYESDRTADAIRRR